MVDSARPPNTTVPIPRYNSEPAPGKITSGTSPNSEVSVDMKIGRIRFRVASIIASETSIASSEICRMVCSTSRMALFTTTPVRITNPSIVSISSGCLIYRLSICRPKIPPAIATGIARIIIRGRIKDLSNTASSSTITPSAVSTFVCMADQVRFSSPAAPLTSTETFCALASLSISGRISVLISCTAFSSGISSIGRRRIDKASLPSSLLMVCGAETISTSAICES